MHTRDIFIAVSMPVPATETRRRRHLMMPADTDELPRTGSIRSGDDGGGRAFRDGILAI